MKVVVTNGIGEKLYIEVDAKNHVNGFEEQISKRMGMDANEFRKTKNLFFQGKLLSTSSDAKLSDLGLYNGGNLLLLDKRKIREKSKEVQLEPMMMEEIEKRTKIFGKKEVPSPAEKLPMNSVGEKLIDLFQALLSSQLSEEEEQPENEEQPNGQQPQQQEQQAEQAQEQGVEAVQQQQNQQQEEPKLPEVNQDALEQLKDMGFSEERARKALLLTGDAESALNWLFQHEDDPHADDPLTEEEVQRIMHKNSTQVNEQALQQLLEMGFPKEDCITALQLTNNNYERACAWLLGDRELPANPPVEASNIVQLLLSPMIQSMQSNPQIAQSLQDPRTLIALQEVINNPRRISNYVNDPVIAPVLLEAVRFLRRLS